MLFEGSSSRGRAKRLLKSKSPEARQLGKSKAQRIIAKNQLGKNKNQKAREKVPFDSDSERLNYAGSRRRGDPGTGGQNKSVARRNIQLSKAERLGKDSPVGNKTRMGRNLP